MLDNSRVLQWIAGFFQETHLQETQTTASQALHSQSPAQSVIPQTLLRLLEQLPIPIQIQQENGEVIHQNQAWQLQITQEYQIVQETASTVTQWFSTSLEDDSTPAETRSASSSPHEMADPLGLKWTEQFGDPLGRELLLDSEPGQTPLPHWCYPGTQPDTYVCVCPVPEDQERVWQFIRQPLVHPADPVLALWGETHPDQTGIHPQFWLVMAQDMTEQHRVAQELAAKNADLIQLNRLKDEFLACISHELKTPLTAVLGLSSLLKERAIGVLNDRQLRYAQLIHQSGRHLMAVVNDILDLTRMETGQLELSLDTVQIREVCDRAFNAALQLQHRSEASAVSNPQPEANPHQRFQLEIEPGLSAMVADELRLQQMLVNLLSNALKFTPNAGAIGLKVSHWEDWIAFTVWDTGIGIPEDKQHLIFQKFQQLESPLTRQFEGTGLGLVLTQRLARLHGGDVSFISKQSQGSEFTLLLPPSPPQNDWETHPLDSHQGAHQGPAVPEPRSTDPALRPSPQIQSRLILVVEATARFIHDLSDQLAHFGYRIVVARSGTEAVEKARRLQPRMIFLNPLIPLLSGWDVLTLLKTNTQTRQIPVIITATSGEKKRAVSQHCDGFLSLPVQKSELQKVLATLNAYVVPQSPQQRLTILWLHPVDPELHTQPPALNSEQTAIDYASAVLDHFSPCRVLEADDLDQAELIARIWQPDVAILQINASETATRNFFEDFSEYSDLVQIPLITLDAITTQMANQVQELAVFPCFVTDNHSDSPLSPPRPILEASLLQAIQVAVGMTWKPNILVVDLTNLMDLDTVADPVAQSTVDLGSLNYSQDSSDHQIFLDSDSENWQPDEIQSSSGFAPWDPTSKIDLALVQYLQTAGFRGSMSHSWLEVLQQIQCQSVDLLLICTRDSRLESLTQAILSLQSVGVRPPIIILDQSKFRIGINPAPASETPDYYSAFPVTTRHLIEQMKIKILPCRIPMVELLEHLKQSLGLKK
ncbi:MAG: hybrid sensor histidine kinase/response regulator [Oscillatoriales cyanobacterium RM2_1_1]|nr:hybrid sensor histidine kinase/response regulator [Oscillatoriales cyanobacterium SM2_3_0]NJO45040.1 hybrid sensor histidine kinase/response regulator [Oscillatoriales cyanobacterium RM2_1_1]